MTDDELREMAVRAADMYTDGSDAAVLARAVLGLMLDRDLARKTIEVSAEQHVGVVAQCRAAERERDAALAELERFRQSVTDQLQYDMNAVLSDTPEKRARIALREATERAEAAEREAERWRHGAPIEGDFVCPNDLRAYNAEQERDASRVRADHAEQECICNLASYEMAQMKLDAISDALGLGDVPAGKLPPLAEKVRGLRSEVEGAMGNWETCLEQRDEAWDALRKVNAVCEICPLCKTPRHLPDCPIGAVIPQKPAFRQPSFYVASKVKHGAMWKEIRTKYPICSTWIDECEEGQTKSWSDLWSRCIGEICGCSALILYVEPGEALKGALAEVGAALAMGKTVWVVGEPDARYSVFHHPLVRRTDGTPEEVFNAALLEIYR